MLKIAVANIIKSFNANCKFLLSTFVVNNPTTGKPCVEFPNTDGNTEMQN